MTLTLAAALIKVIYDITKDLIKLSSSKISFNETKTVDSFQRHLIEIERWSSQIQFFGMASPKHTDQYTTALRIAQTPRRFFSGQLQNDLTEDQLLANSNHLILLGDPGSGKTTTAKRLARSLIIQEPTANNARFNFPLVIIARELQKDEGLMLAIARILVADYLKPAPIDSQGYQIWTRQRDDALTEAVLDFMSGAEVLLIIDGVDEVGYETRQIIDRDLVKLGRALSKGKIVATCRSGDYLRPIESFDTVELQPLSTEEIEEIVRLWCAEPDVFLTQVKPKPYSDLLDKPLYLCQIVLVFNEYRNLPEYSGDIYRRIIYLMLEKWDRERGITRLTTYTSFVVEAKQSFLAHFAYELFSRYNARLFDHNNLIMIYISIHTKFGLPRDQAEAVVNEIESHTGIIVMPTIDKYQFSHLSIQEYLAAQYLYGRSDTIAAALQVFQRYPAPVALAVCLSSEPSVYFRDFTFALRDSELLMTAIPQIRSWLHRVMLEGPRFSESAGLGAAILLLGDTFTTEAGDDEFRFVMDDFHKLSMAPEVLRSVNAAVQCYRLSLDEKHVNFDLRPETKSDGPPYERRLRLSSSICEIFDILRAPC